MTGNLNRVLNYLPARHLLSMRRELEEAQTGFLRNENRQLRTDARAASGSVMP